MNGHIYRPMVELFSGLGDVKVLTGMALGVDQLVAEACIEAKVPFTAVLPFEGQAAKWPQSSQDHWARLLEAAVKVIVVSDGGYAGYKMQRRNEWMVDHADALYAWYDHSAVGGTANCVLYAYKQGKPVYDGRNGGEEL